ncbi:hypothetical protein N658DRAFT_494183 [Parathielavia hyrcaniae]|uniref:Secreted protein n=1 Tax=Parathielavia hyrcaniae TaxID=113614 RepID=A0AAN6Q4Z4_9PEZI|nr:hypothetical protein N658DRAFT_494183 [Parathielavia hyrcaniae]
MLGLGLRSRCCLLGTYLSWIQSIHAAEVRGVLTIGHGLRTPPPNRSNEALATEPQYYSNKVTRHASIGRQFLWRGWNGRGKSRHKALAWDWRDASALPVIHDVDITKNGSVQACMHHSKFQNKHCAGKLHTLTSRVRRCGTLVASTWRPSG